MRPNLSMITEGGTVAHFKAAKIGPGQRVDWASVLSPDIARRACRAA